MKQFQTFKNTTFMPEHNLNDYFPLFSLCILRLCGLILSAISIHAFDAITPLF